MKKTILIFAILFTTTVPVFSQTSVGFSDPDDIQPLLDYRLPEWGYDNLFLDFSVDGFRIKSLGNGDSSADNLFSGQFTPVYNRLRESESRMSSLFIITDFDYSGETREEEENQDLQIQLFLNAEERFYKPDSDLFYIGNLSGDFILNKTHDIILNQNLDERLFNRSLTTRFSVGLGYGRVRNVNPVIRSLRLNERLNTLNLNQGLNQEDIANASEQFTRENAYRRNYDRPLKNFWNDMDQLISPDLSALEAFDLLYLTDTSSETIGQRLEGWEVSGTAGIQYNVSYRREEGNFSGESSNLFRNTYFNPILSGSWYKNLSLEHQVGVQLGFTYLIPLNRSRDLRFYTFNVQGSWLYNITDRFLSNLSLRFSRVGRTSGNPSGIISVNSEFDYFMEDKLALFSSVSFSHIRNNTSPERNVFLLNAGIRYYLRRGMF